jgi:AraC-like DNA-binding protein
VGYAILFSMDDRPQTEQELLLEDICKLTFCLGGSLKLRVFRNGEQNEFFVPVGQCSFHYCPGPCRCVECACEKCAKILQLFFPCRDLRRLLGEHQLPPELKSKHGEAIHIVRKVTPAMSLIIDRIKDSVMRSHDCDLFMLAKALELLWLFSHAGNGIPDPGFNECDRKAIQKARFILERNLEAPPTIGDLAGRVGMSASKFKHLFPKVCGEPPYAYLRKVRMEKARDLLSRGKMNVTEVSMEVGYSSLSHFAKAFAKHFGVNPSQVRHLP